MNKMDSFEEARYQLLTCETLEELPEMEPLYRNKLAFSEESFQKVYLVSTDLNKGSISILAGDLYELASDDPQHQRQAFSPTIIGCLRLMSYGIGPGEYLSKHGNLFKVFELELKEGEMIPPYTKEYGNYLEEVLKYVKKVRSWVMEIKDFSVDDETNQITSLSFIKHF